MARRWWFFLVILSGVALCGMRYSQSLFSSFSVISSYVLYPALVFNRVCITPVKQRVGVRKTVTDLEHEIDRLQTRCGALHAETVALRATASYAHDIEEVVGFKNRYDNDKATIAQILVRHCSDRTQYLLVNVGSAHGVQSNAVVVYNNSLVGKITDVYPWYSKVCLITDPTCKIAVYSAKTKARGIVEGTNKTNTLQLRYVSHLSPIRIGEELISSGKGLIFPQGFGLGTVASCELDGLHYKIAVNPHIDVNALDYCVVLPCQGQQMWSV